jgi:hypothetical protein
MAADKKEQEVAVARGKIFRAFFSYQLWNLNRILTFVCYSYYQIHETARWLKGGETAELGVTGKTLETIVGCDRVPVFTGTGSGGGMF